MDVTILREALQTVPNHNCELIVKAVAEKLANSLGEQVIMQCYNYLAAFCTLYKTRKHIFRGK